MTRVLVLCTHNSARSQMAEGWLRRHAGERFNVFSAGFEPKGINPYTVRVMEERGFDLSNQRSKSVGEYLGRDYFIYAITVCDSAEQNCPKAFLNVFKFLHWSFEDPAAFEGSDEAKLGKFREVRDLIDTKIRAWLEELPTPEPTLTS